MLAQEWFYGLMTRPDMSIKVERQLHDMRILGRIVGVRSTEQFKICKKLGKSLKKLLTYLQKMIIIVKQCSKNITQSVEYAQYATGGRLGVRLCQM